MITNSAGPDKILYSAVFHQGLYCFISRMLGLNGFLVFKGYLVILPEFQY